jgi:hypothetical protein
MTRPVPRAATLCGAALLVVALAACGSAASSSGGAPTAGLAVATAPPPDSADPNEDDADAAAVHGPVSANSAPEDEITEALTDAGVGNPARWAKEVVAHRPYPADDPKLTKLRSALAADHPGPGTVDKIVSALKP